MGISDLSEDVGAAYPIDIKASAPADGDVRDQEQCLKGLTSAASQLMGSPPGSSNTSDFSSSEDEQMPQAEHAAAVHGLQLQELIGRGAFGSVYRAVWRGMQVAVKVGNNALRKVLCYYPMYAHIRRWRFQKRRSCDDCIGDRARR
jgi:hypothetical protein